MKRFILTIPDSIIQCTHFEEVVNLLTQVLLAFYEKEVCDNILMFFASLVLETEGVEG